ncbi:MAG: PorP/SprF family type IX secretion system membrane protein [Cyclobacteriaceae bacterium]
MQVCLRFFSLFLFFCAVYTQAQQQIQFSHTEELYPLVQPAFRSSTERSQVSVGNRSEWAGYNPSTDIGNNGNPITQAVFLFIPISLKGEGDKKESVSFSLINDNIGVTNQKRMSGAFSKQVKLSKSSKLSFGLKPSILIQKLKQQEYVFIDSDDPLVNALRASNSLSSATVDVGLWYYTLNYGIGLSVNNIMESNDLLIGSRIVQVDFYSDIKLTPNVSFVPRLNLLSDFHSLSWLVGAFTRLSILDHSIKTGFLVRQSSSRVSYSINDIGLQLGIPQVRGTQIGFSYTVDFSTNQTGAKSATSHEVLLSYYLGRRKRLNQRPLYSPRYKIGE